MSIESVAAQSGVFATQIAKGSQGAPTGAFSELFDKPEAQPNINIAEAAKNALRKSRNLLGPVTNAHVTDISLSPKVGSKSGQKEIMDVVEKMLHKANQSTNHMNDTARARVSEEFEELSQKLSGMIEKYGIFEEGAVGFVQSYIDHMDISTQAGAAQAYTDLRATEDHIRNEFGINFIDDTSPYDHMNSLNALQAMARRSASQMSDAAREVLNKQFHEKVDTYMKELRDSGLFESDVVLDFMEQYMQGMDLSTQEGAQFAFNNLENQEVYIESLLQDDITT